MEKTYNTQLICPFSMVISGSSNTGKSELVMKLIEHAPVMISPPVDLIYYCYKIHQDRFNDVKGVTFFENFDESIISEENLKGRSVMLILDDMMTDIPEKTLLDLFLVGRHKHVYPIFICHNLYYSGLKSMRTISLNTSYNIIMKNPRDKSSTRVLGSQMFTGQTPWFMEAYSYATREPWSYIFIDSKATQADECRVRSRIFPGDDIICFVPHIKAKK